MTADGLRALLRCGLGADHPRVVAARKWLLRHFAAAHNPGDFPADRAVLRDATYYYWTWAASHAFLALGLARLETPAGPVAWPEQFAEELLARQCADGSWVNRFTDAKEDDPLDRHALGRRGLGHRPGDGDAAAHHAGRSLPGGPAGQVTAAGHFPCTRYFHAKQGRRSHPLSPC